MTLRILCSLLGVEMESSQRGAIQPIQKEAIW
jgi:hypothetical protein